ncbi:MAG: cyclic nucleotide-binding domain-containing protein [Chloroflexi bacterium]|nr:MAG: cyclic nucleotide-binding domain-containing protein [Chloroflexota bacterium]
MEISKLLKRVPIFAGLTDDELAQIAVICTPKKVQPGELIIQQNTTGTEMHLIADGAAEVFIEGVDNERSLVVLGKGQVIGEMALIDQGYRSASVRATKEGAMLYTIESQQFYALCEQNTRIGFVVMRNLAIDIAFKLRHRNLAEL